MAQPQFFPIPPVGSTNGPAAVSPNRGAAAPALGGAGLGGGSAVVQLSGYGQLLSAVGGFQSQLQSLGQRFAGGASSDFFADLSTVSAGAQGLADAFNQLQGRMNDLQRLVGSAPGAPNLMSSFQQALNAQAAAVLANGESILTSLARIGVDFVPPAIPGAGGSLGVDLDRLQAALNYDPPGTFSVLSQAARTLGDIATRFAGQTADATMVLGMLAQFQSTQLNLAMNDNAGFGPGFPGFNDQAALAQPPRDAAGNPLQRAIALNQFARVSTFF